MLNNKAYFDVIVIGAGPAGITAAAGIAKQGISVAVIEGAVYPGAENWSGCVYFAENLVLPEIFGEEIIKNAPYERKVVKRGIFITDGVTSIGAEYTSQEIFKHSYIVLRPIFDRYLAYEAKKLGVVIFTEVHARNLLRRGKRIIGVDTERGPVYSKVVFLAEGDASELVAKEGYETSSNPSFMQGIKLVLKLSKIELEKRFGLKDGDGTAYEILVRNANIGGRTVPLNIAGFLYTNRESISLGLIVSIENLKENFNGNHNILIEWYRSLPFIKKITEGASLVSFGAKLIRSGGIKQMPELVDDGLAIGGASTGLGIDLPYPNFTGPATCTGNIFSKAVGNIIKNNSDFTKKELNDKYVVPLLNTHYAINAKSLENWPLYLEKTRALFESYIDLPLSFLNVSYSEELSPITRLSSRARILRDYLSPKKIQSLNKDFKIFKHSIKFKMNNIIFYLLRNTIMEPFFLFSKNDNNFKLKLFIRDKEVTQEKLPFFIKYRLKIYNPIIREIMSTVYNNNSVPWKDKLSGAVKSLKSRISVIDIVGFGIIFFIYAIIAGFTALYDAIRFFILKVPPDKILNNFSEHYKNEMKKMCSLDATSVRITDTIEKKLSTITYLPVPDSHIIFNWPLKLIENKNIENYSIWHICPAYVYSFKNAFTGYPKLNIEYENCIKCETCWHSMDVLNWSRSGKHRLIYEVYSEAMDELISKINKESPKLLTYNNSSSNKAILPDENITNKIKDIIDTFGIICIHFSYRLEHTKSHLIDNTKREWLGRLFLWAEEIINKAIKENTDNDLSNILKEIEE
ncbi:MAG: FAD-binding protein, partial [Candidatus Firestonebacteria bacterium]|nr:FAD-binding protein [Candidatus Firestonebacteria bacterium]